MQAGLPAKLILRDIHVPPAPSWWPPAPGWWCLFIVLCVLLGGVLCLALRYRRRRQLGMRLLQAVGELDTKYPDSEALACALHQLLRRGARIYDPDATQKRGHAWRETLARVRVKPETIDVLMSLERQIYQPMMPDFDRVRVLQATREWLIQASSQRLHAQSGFVYV